MTLARLEQIFASRKVPYVRDNIGLVVTAEGAFNVAYPILFSSRQQGIVQAEVWFPEMDRPPEPKAATELCDELYHRFCESITVGFHPERKSFYLAATFPVEISRQQIPLLAQACDMAFPLCAALMRGEKCDRNLVNLSFMPVDWFFRA